MKKLKPGTYEVHLLWMDWKFKVTFYVHDHAGTFDFYESDIILCEYKLFDNGSPTFPFTGNTGARFGKLYEGSLEDAISDEADGLHIAICKFLRDLQTAIEFLVKNGELSYTDIGDSRSTRALKKVKPTKI